MANTRRSPSGAQKPQLDYYEYKRQREERLRRRAEAEGRVWQPPVDPLPAVIGEPAEPERLRLGVEPFHFVSSIRRASSLAFLYRILYLSSSLIRENRTLPMP